MTTEETTYGRLEKKIDQMQVQINIMNEGLIRLTAHNDAYQSQASSNSRELDVLQAEMNQAKGGLTFAKALATTALGAVLSFGVWTVQSLATMQQRISDTNQQVALNQSKLIRLDTDISVLANRPPLEKPDAH